MTRQLGLAMLDENPRCYSNFTTKEYFFSFLFKIKGANLTIICTFSIFNEQFQCQLHPLCVHSSALTTLFITEFNSLIKRINTLIASCIKRTVISMPKSSPATLVNLLIILQAFKTARRKRKNAVQTQTLQILHQKMNIFRTSNFTQGNMK